MTHMLNRRSFIAGATATVASGIAVPAVAMDFCKAPDKWDETYDVIVIGSGGAGLTAAIVAREAGAKTLILEKMSFPGGNTLIAGGGFNAAIKEDSEKAGVQDSPELHASQTLAAGDYRADPELVRMLTEGAPESVAWLKKRGVKFQDYIYQIYGGIYPRCRNPLGPRGQAYIKALVPVAEKIGVELRCDAKVTGIHREKPFEGRVTGVEVEVAGKKLNIRARKAVIACAGGFAANAKMCGLHDPRLEKLGTTNQPGATGEVLLSLIDIGAGTRGMDYVQCIPDKPLDVKRNPALSTQVDRFVFVNHEGKRFVAEDSRRDILRDAVLAQTKMEAFPVIDDVGFELQKNSKGPENEAARQEGTLFVGETLDELAAKMQVPAEALKATIAEYNKAVDEKKDPFGRNANMLIHKIEKAPFYSCRIVMARHHTMGGACINTKAQVLDRHGNVIEGLYAAGEITGGIHGTNRVGGNAIADIFTFGRIAGVNATSNA